LALKKVEKLKRVRWGNVRYNSSSNGLIHFNVRQFDHNDVSDVSFNLGAYGI